MKTFWLYYGNLIVGGFRCKPDASPADVRCHAAMQFSDVPGVFPNYVTRGMILSSTVKT